MTPNSTMVSEVSIPGLVEGPFVSEPLQDFLLKSRK